MNPKTFSQFQLPLKPPYVWGNICNQYDWPVLAKPDLMHPNSKSVRVFSAPNPSAYHLIF
jgi:hypothetical protein